MQQEDDLRGLAKVMDFMRALSILFVVIHIYWFCYGQIEEWEIRIGVVDRILLNFDRTAGLFGNMLRTKLFAVVFLALSCLGTTGVKEEKDHVAENHRVAVRRRRAVFLQLVAAGAAASDGCRYGVLHTDRIGRIYLPNDGRRMDVPPAEKQPDGRRVQHRERIVSAGDAPLDQRILGEPAHALLLPQAVERGWINVVNPFRAAIVLGTPGSGKSYAVVNQFIKQQIEKGFAMYLYDFKFPDLSEIAYNHLLNNQGGYKKVPTFYVIYFDDPRRSHRCNPINPDFMTDISDAYESAYTIMLNLNRTWVQKQGDFFVESPIILFAAIIWYLRIYKGGRYCTFPHAVEFLNKRYEDIFPILTSYPELENYLSPFMDAWLGGAQDQLQGQIASAKIPLSRMISRNSTGSCRATSSPST